MNPTDAKLIKALNDRFDQFPHDAEWRRIKKMFTKRKKVICKKCGNVMLVRKN
jgi:hypothetical protein